MKFNKEIKTNYIDPDGDYIDADGIDIEGFNQLPVMYKDDSLPVGKCTKIEKTKSGLIVEGEIVGDENIKKVKDIIEFFLLAPSYSIQEVQHSDGNRKITKCKLVDVNLVPTINEVK